MMAATATRPSSSPAFDDRLSLDASMEDFEGNEHSPALSIPSQHSGFKSSDGSESDHEEVASDEPWSPPAWRNIHNTGGWYRHQPYTQDPPRHKDSKSASRSRETSRESYESALDEEGEETTRPADIPLPRGSLSPFKEGPPAPTKRESLSPAPHANEGQNRIPDFNESGANLDSPGNTNQNCLTLISCLSSAVFVANTVSQSFALPFAPKSNNAPSPLTLPLHGCGRTLIMLPNHGAPCLPRF